MKKIIFVLLIGICLLTSCQQKKETSAADSLIANETSVADGVESKQNLEINTYVNSVEGLRVRKEPNINSERIFLLNHLEKVTILEKGNYVTIDDINGNWVLIKTANITGWVFDGYLGQKKDFQERQNKFVREGFGFKFDFDTYESRKKFIEIHGEPIKISKKPTINRYTGSEDQYVFMTYNNFSVTFYEWNVNRGEDWPESRMEGIFSRDNCEYLFGIKHGMTMDELTKIFGIENENSSLVWLENNGDRREAFSFAHIKIDNNKIEYIAWYYTLE